MFSYAFCKQKSNVAYTEAANLVVGLGEKKLQYPDTYFFNCSFRLLRQIRVPMWDENLKNFDQLMVYLLT